MYQMYQMNKRGLNLASLAYLRSALEMSLMCFSQCRGTAQSPPAPAERSPGDCLVSHVQYWET
jgi:hypothetical protein